jgi:hypothetical protein
MSTPLDVSHEDVVVLAYGAFFKEKDADLTVGATFTAGFKEMLRHSYNTDNFCLVEYVCNYVFIRWVAQDALG